MGLKDAAFRWVESGRVVAVEAAGDFKTFLVEAVAEGAKDAVVALFKNLLTSAVNAVGTGFTMFILCTQFGMFCKVFGLQHDDGNGNGTTGNGGTGNGDGTTTEFVAETTTEEAIEGTTTEAVEETVTRIGETATTETTRAGPTETVPPDGGFVPADILSEQVIVVVLTVFVVSFVILGIRAQRA